MIVTSLRYMFCILGMLFVLTKPMAQGSPGAYPIDAKMRQMDNRLNVPVSFHADRMYLGELLENLTAQTHVALSTDLDSSFSGTRITCDLKKLPLADVMNSLCSLVGFKDAPWEWRSETRQGTLRYNFRPTRSATVLSERLTKEMQEAFEAQADLMIKMAQMSPQDRQANVDKLATSMLLTDTKVAQEFVSPSLDRFWAAIRLFAAAVPPDQRTRIWRGETVNIPLASLSDADRQLALKLGGKNTVIVTNEGREEIVPDTIRFKTTRYNGDRKVISMQMFISVGGKAGFQGMSYFGMLTFGLLARAYEGWILSGDQKIRDIEMHAITALAPFQPEGSWLGTPQLDRDIVQLAVTEGVSFLALIPEYSGSPLPAILGKTPKQYFEDLWKDEPYVMHKWRRDVLLANYPTWFYGDDAQYSYAVVKRLRVSKRNQEGLLKLEDVTEAVTTLKEAQWKRLGEEFPDFKNARQILPIATVYKQYPQALSAKGVPVDLKMQGFLKAHGLWPSPLEEDERILAARILDEHETGIAMPRHTYHLQLASSKRTWTDIAVCRLMSVM